MSDAQHAAAGESRDQAPSRAEDGSVPASRRRARSGFLALPPLWRPAAILAVGGVLSLGAHAYRRSRRPEEVPAATAAQGLAAVRSVLQTVGAGEFGRSQRGAELTARARRLLEGGQIRFSAEISGEALCYRERGGATLLYVRVEGPAARHVLPSRGELAERVYHETLHALKDSPRKCLEEEWDAFSAAAEARAAVEGRTLSFPLKRDGLELREWVRRAYPELGSDPDYRPVGRTREELAVRAGTQR